MVILDTSFIIDVMRRDAAALATLDRLETGSEPLRVPAPVFYELWEGIDRSEKPIRELKAVEDVLESYPPLEVQIPAAKRAGKLSGALIRSGQDIDDMDLLVAGMALEAGEAVVTRNERDFGRIDDLKLITY